MAEEQEQIQEEITEETAGDEIQEEVVEEVNPDHEQAMRNGWRPKEEWNGDSDEWVSAKKFNERGQMIGDIRQLKRRLDSQEESFGNRLDHHKKLQEAQMKVAISDLESRRDEAIDLADREKANSIQSQIDDTRAQAVEPAPAPAQNGQTVLDEWNANNSWVNENTPKAAFAKMMFVQHSQNKSVEDAITATEADITKEYPDVNPRREQASTVESGRSKPGARVSSKLNWSQLTADEVKWFNVMPGTWTKEEFLQTVQDERSAK